MAAAERAAELRAAGRPYCRVPNGEQAPPRSYRSEKAPRGSRLPKYIRAIGRFDTVLVAPSRSAICSRALCSAQ